MSHDQSPTLTQYISPFADFGYLRYDQHHGYAASVPSQRQDDFTFCDISGYLYQEADQKLVQPTCETDPYAATSYGGDAEYATMNAFDLSSVTPTKLSTHHRDHLELDSSELLENMHGCPVIMTAGSDNQEIAPEHEDSQDNSQSQPRQKKTNGLFFSSLEEAVVSMPTPTWRSPANDAGVPTTDHERQKWVVRLLDAVNNIENTHDKQGAVFKKRWFDPSKGASSFYSAVDKEILCWDILDLAERLHRDGPKVFLAFDPTFWKHAAKTRFWDFEKRMKNIIELLTYSKGRCDKLLTGVGLQLIVANPTVLINTTKDNVRQNKKRQALLNAGRVAKRRCAPQRAMSDVRGDQDVSLADSPDGDTF
ncbi:hypothetical protein BKA66DRAFT_443394 [Pyrenochaeta sp. MPI-SDFR-AT-0127]|nr:hypothetical protein BKA66DRAFT_443394 [Pyrenochaeta sp. MPI-SDFR-AT-0127]